MHTVNARWDVSDNDRVEYVFGHFKTDEKVYQDWDGTALTLYHTDRPADWNQSSHELRLTHGGDRLSYTVGAYSVGFRLPHRPVELHRLRRLPVRPAGRHGADRAAERRADHRVRGGLLRGRLQVHRSWTLTLGGRYTKDEKDSGVDRPDHARARGQGQPRQSVRESWSEFTPKVGLRFPADRRPDVLRPVLERVSAPAASAAARAPTKPTRRPTTRRRSTTSRSA